MESARDVVLRHVPSSWVQTSVIPGQAYELFPVRNPEEFRVVTNHMPSAFFQVLSVRRMQNIYMYARYAIRVQQLKTTNSSNFKECIRYVCIRPDDINIIGEYNVDFRRLKLCSEDFNLFTTPEEAHAHAVNGCNSSADLATASKRVMVVCRSAATWQDNLPKHEMDCDLYPEYIVEYTAN